MSELLEDINNILCGVITTERGEAERIDSSLVRPRFEEQIAIFYDKWKTFDKAKRRRDKLYNTKKAKPPKKGLVWDDDLECYCPKDSSVREEDLPPDPTDWELENDLPCAYATLTTIYDKVEKVPKKRIHTGIWDRFLFAWMIDRIEYYKDWLIKKAFSKVKKDLLVAGILRDIEINLDNFSKGPSKQLLMDLASCPSGVPYSMTLHGKKQPSTLKERLEDNGYGHFKIFFHRKRNRIYCDKNIKLTQNNTA
ncbi:MAG: hypothetical protein GY845_20650 [Planctomycetes bacterium]|nr:hypothetical protein [Planctomycetota bacterium]